MITYMYDLHFNVNIPKITISLLETWNLLLFYIENVWQKNAISNVNNEPLNFFFYSYFYNKQSFTALSLIDDQF